MKTNKSKPVAKKKTTISDLIIELRQTLLILKLEKQAGRLLKTHRIKTLKKEIARNLTKIKQKKQKEAEEDKLKMKGEEI